jgi:hypothetical protein
MLSHFRINCIILSFLVQLFSAFHVNPILFIDLFSIKKMTFWQEFLKASKEKAKRLSKGTKKNITAVF